MSWYGRLFFGGREYPGHSPLRALGATGGKLDSAKNCSHLAELGDCAPLCARAAGRYVWSAASFDERGVSPTPRAASQMAACVS